MVSCFEDEDEISSKKNWRNIICESAEGFKDLGGLFTAEKENRMIMT